MYDGVKNSVPNAILSLAKTCLAAMPWGLGFQCDLCYNAGRLTPLPG